MSRIRALPIVAILVLLLSFGCAKITPSEPEKIEYHIGFGGLDMALLKNHPPEEVGAASQFIIGFELRNKGPYPIRDGTIVISGFNPDYIVLDNYQALFSLEGRSLAYPEGDYRIINFKARNIAVPKGSDEYPAAFTARAYYDYQTEATANVCINPDIYSYVKTKEVGCEVREVTLPKGQGAPVAVTRIEEMISSLADEPYIFIEFKIHIANKAKGEVLGNVKVDEVRLVDKKLKCYPETLELKDMEEKAIRCQITLDKTKGAYLTPLTTRLSYSYTQKIDKKFKIIAFTLK